MEHSDRRMYRLARREKSRQHTDSKTLNLGHSTVKHGGARIMIWGYDGVGPIYCILGIIGQFEYIKNT